MADQSDATADPRVIRRRAWVTRRAKYGERGHAGSYALLVSEPWRW